MIGTTLILGMVTWRVSSLLLYEDGPFDLFVRLRRLAGTEEPGEVRSLAKLFSCIWCMSVWVGVALSLTKPDDDWWFLLFRGLAASAIAIIVDKHIRITSA